MALNLKERYPDYMNIIPAQLKKQLNKICYRYSGWKLPQEIAPMWDELYDLGVEVLITGSPQTVMGGSKSWVVQFKYNGETVDNSRFIYDVYEGSDTLKNEYNMYFS